MNDIDKEIAKLKNKKRELREAEFTEAIGSLNVIHDEKGRLKSFECYTFPSYFYGHTNPLIEAKENDNCNSISIGLLSENGEKLRIRIEVVAWGENE